MADTGDYDPHTMEGVDAYILGGNYSVNDSRHGDNFSGQPFGDHGATDFETFFYYYLWMYAAPAVFVLIFVVGTIGNSLVITVILSKKSMRTVTNFLLLNLAIADITFLIICIPFTAYKYIAFTWPFGDVTCKVVQYFVYVSTYITVYTLVLISALRYLTVVWSVETQKYRTKRNTVFIIIFLWFLMLSANIPVMLAHKTKEVNSYSYCGMVDGTVLPLFIAFFVTAYALPLVAICFLYLLILCHLRKQKSAMLDKGGSRDRTTHAFRIIMVVIVVFALSWLPHHVNSLVSVFAALPKGAWYEVFRILWYCMAYGNSCANPLIYHYGSQEFRKSFREAICCKFLTKQRRARNAYSENGNTAETTAMV